MAKKLLEELGIKVQGNKIIIPGDKKYNRTFIDSIESAIKDKIEIIPKDEFVFVIESYGQYSAEKILLLGIQELKNKVKKLIEELIS